MLSGVLWLKLRHHGDSQVLFSHATETLDCSGSMARTLEFLRKATMSLSLMTVSHHQLCPDMEIHLCSSCLNKTGIFVFKHFSYQNYRMIHQLEIEKQT